MSCMDDIQKMHAEDWVLEPEIYPALIVEQAGHRFTNFHGDRFYAWQVIDGEFGLENQLYFVCSDDSWKVYRTKDVRKAPKVPPCFLAEAEQMWLMAVLHQARDIEKTVAELRDRERRPPDVITD